MKYKIIVLITLLSLGFNGFSQVLINEFSASNKNDYANGLGDFEDWIELYNTSATAVNIGGYYLSDKATNPTKYKIPAGVNVPANGRIMFFCSGDSGLFAGQYHTGFKLTQTTSEDVVFADPTAVIIDQVNMIPARNNHSRGRLTDGDPTWGVFTNPTPNATNTGAFTDYAPKPVFNLAAGFYAAAQNITITCADPTAEIRYTTDGQNPTATSTLYTGPINVANTTMIRAAAYPTNTQFARSFVETNTYFINENHQLPVVSLGGDYSSLFNGGWGAPSELYTTFEMFDGTPTHNFQHEGDGDVRRHGNDSWAFPQKGIRFHTRDEYGYANNVEAPVFPSTPRDEFDVLIMKAAGSDNYPAATQQVNGCLSTHLRDAFSQTITEKYGLNMDVRRYQPAVVYINGQYWGLYELRERVDADYTNFYYGQGGPSIDMLEYWGGLTVEEGSDTGWVSLFNFCTGNNMAVQNNYDIVASQYNLMSLIDYMILNTYTVNSDWLIWNTSWWRGRKNTANTPRVKWKYSLWDQDNTFRLTDGAWDYTGIGNMNATADPCNVQDDPGYANDNDPETGHVALFVSLWDNQNFRDLYINRYAELTQTVFNCDTMLTHLQNMVNVLNTEMPQQVARWGGSMGEWNENLDTLRAQIQTRCAVIEQGMVDCYTLTGPFPITTDVVPAGAGTVTVNTYTPPTYPHTTDFFGTVNLGFRANANTAAGYMFDYWEVLQDTVNPNINMDTVSMYVDGPATVIAHFKSLFDIVNNDTTLCDGGNILLIAQGGSTYNWTTTASSNSLGNGQVLIVSPTSTTSYICTSNAGADTVTITVNTSPQFTLGEDQQFCDVASVTITPQFTGTIPTGVTYSWQDGSTASTYNATTTNTYSLTVDNNGCSSSASVNYIFSTTPSVNLGADVLSCNGTSSLTLDAGFIAGASYQWQDGSAVSTYNVVNSGVYWVTVNNQGCTDQDTVSIILSQTPVVDLGSDATVCDGTTSLILSAEYFPTATYLWQDGSASSNYTVQHSGTFYVLADNQGCTATDTVSIVIGDIPPTDLGPDRNLCPDKEILLSVMQPEVNVTWQDGSHYLQYYVKTPGTYSVTVVNTQGCINSDTITIGMSPLDGFDLGDDVSMCFGDSLVLTPNVPVGSNYTWTINDAPNQPLIIKEAGIYSVEVVHEGCRVNDKLAVTITDCKTCRVYAPSAFTPNGDGYNDVFLLGANCQQGSEFSFRIYDRYGAKIFEGAAITDGWDGKIKGVDAPEGVYTFHLDCLLIDEGSEKRFQQGGTITLVR